MIFVWLCLREFVMEFYPDFGSCFTFNSEFRCSKLICQSPIAAVLQVYVAAWILEATWYKVL